MKIFLALLISAALGTCNTEGRSHRYLHDKNPSEKLDRQLKKMSKHADKTFHKNLRKNKKHIGKGGK
ncbi:MAG TPA: hypothetical protein VL651_02995 [Bacteroidia bacterium]|jgi:hypothetical protein|nr:hypothetical protein [Bacteroidia bacterium]